MSTFTLSTKSNLSDEKITSLTKAEEGSEIPTSSRFEIPFFVHLRKKKKKKSVAGPACFVRVTDSKRVTTVVEEKKTQKKETKNR